MKLKYLLAATVAASLLAFAGAPALAQDTSSSQVADPAAAAAAEPSCWGFTVLHSYLVHEDQYPGGTITFPFGDGVTMEATYNRAFILHLKETGEWGLTLDGQYLQKSADNEDPTGKKIWRLSDVGPTSANGHPMTIGMVATNRLDLFPYGTKVSIDGGPPLLVDDFASEDPNTMSLIVVWNPDFEDLEDATVCIVP